MSTTSGVSTTGVTPISFSSTVPDINHKVKIFLPCHYDLSQVETCAPFLDRYGGVVFVYDWNLAKDTITEYYRKQYPDGWVKVMPFSLRNILIAIRDLDHRLYRCENSESNLTTHITHITHINDISNGMFHSHSTENFSNSGAGRSNSLTSVGSSGSLHSIEAKKQHQVVFLLTGSMNPEYGVFGLVQKKILEAVRDVLPERVRGVNVIGHCMYGCASCSGVEHKVPLYFTRYFNKTLPYTAQDVLALYAAPRTGASNTARIVLVAPSCGSTSIVAQKPLIELFHHLERSGHWKFIWKLHPSSLQFKSYDTEEASGVDKIELENIKFILVNFTVTQDEHSCLLPFMEAFDVIITDLHSSVPFIATYFTPKVILSYFNDADYGVPERHQQFMDQLSTFVEPEELETLLKTLPAAKGDPSFFHSQYGHVDGKEDLRFGNLAGWPTEQFEPSQPLQYRKSLAQLALEWKKIYKSTTEQYPDDIEGANNALGFHAKFELLKDEDAVTVPVTLPRVLPRDRQAAGIELRIMSFNIWNGGLSGGQPLQQTAKAILSSGADIVGLQECSTITDDSGKRRYMLPELMKYLPGWYYSDQKLRPTSTGPRNPWGVVSKFPIVGITEMGFGVKIQLNDHRHPEIDLSYNGIPDNQYQLFEQSQSPVPISILEGNCTGYKTPRNRFMYLFNCHLYYFPYQPFQLLKIPYSDQPFLNTAEEAIQSCIEARGKDMESILSEIRQVAEQEKDVPIFLTGDLNEPSHLDWTPLSVLAGLHPMPVSWPVTEMAYKAGLIDLWRAFRPHTTSSSSKSSCFTNREGSQFGKNGICNVDSIEPNDKEEAEYRVIERPGFTWTVLEHEMDANDHYDRIDYIFGLNRESSPIALKEIAIKMGEEVGRSGEKNDKVLKPWPSDHRAVVATVLL
ncbi:hypothetical protein BGZ49_007578 [Haplosporangium sp. Z 27]|nr:hypothetical protein BGZ49_007578 [Haplosporangium sp. Z 27]